MWIVVLCLARCSTLGTINTPPPIHTSVGMPTSPMVVTPTLLPLTGKIAFLWGSGEIWGDIHIYTMNANGSELMDVTPPNLRSINNLSWSPDGQHIAFEASKDGVIQIFKMKANGSDLVQLTFGEEHSYRPSWSPDGKNMLFASSSRDILDYNDLPAQQIYIMKSDGSEVRRFIVERKTNNTSMSGRYRMDGLIAVVEPITRYAVVNYIVNSDGVIQKQFPEFRTTAPIVWSPDGKFVVYSPSRVNSDCFGLVLRKFDGSEIFCLKIDEAITNQTSGQIIGVEGASWSPDGKYLIFSSNLDGDTDIYVIKPDDTGLSQLTNLPGNEGGAVWWSAP